MVKQVLASVGGAQADWVDDTGKQIYRFVYDFSVLGGATGSIPLTALDGLLPDKFVALGSYIDVITALVGGAGSTAALTTGQGAGDLVVAAVVAGAPWSTTGVKATLNIVGTLASAFKMTAERTPALVVAVNAITVGKFILFVEGVTSQ